MQLSIRAFLFVPFLAVAAAAAQQLRGPAESVKLNLPLPRDPGQHGGSVSLSLLTPDATRLVYIAREQGDARPELRSWLLDQSTAPVKLTGAISPREDIVHDTFLFTTDGTQLLFSTQESEELPDGEYLTTYRIYRVPVDGGARPTLLALPETTRFYLAGEWLVFETHDESWNPELRAVPLDGHVGPALLAEKADFVASTSERVLYLGHPESTVELFSVRPDGTGPARIDGPLGQRGRVFEAQITPDKTRIVYRADQLVAGKTEVFSAPIDGSSPGVRISGPMADNRDVNDLVTVSPDSARALYFSNQESSIDQLYSAPLDGSAAAVKLNGPLVMSARVSSARFSADGQRVVYSADALVAGRVQLFSVPSDASGPVVTLTPLPPSPTFLTDILVTPQNRVLYGQGATNSIMDLRMVPVDGSAAPASLSQLSNSFSDVQRYVVSAEGSTVAFFADAEVDGRFDLHTVPASGGIQPVRLNATEVPLAAVLTPDGEQVFYTARESGTNQRNLLFCPSDASAPAVQINAALSQGDVWGNVITFAMDASGERVVYLADQLQDELDDVVSVDVPRRSEHLFLSDPSPIQSSIVTLRIVGSRCLYVQAPGPSQTAKLFSVPLDRSLAPIQLSSSAGHASLFEATADGQGVVFVDYASDQRRLLAAPVDGASPAVPVSGPLVQGGNVESFRTTPDSSRALYIADGTQNGRLELYSAPLDGSAAPISISGALVAGGEVLRWHPYDAPLTTESELVVFRADAFVNDRAELFSAPVDGSQPRTRLSGNVTVPGGDVQAPFALAADGERVVYRADFLADERFELFSAPVDGSTPPVRLNGSLVAGGDVADFRLTPDGSHVLYIADQLKDERFELFVAPVENGERARLLSAPSLDAGDVQNVVIDPQGAFAVYLADQVDDEQAELFLVALDGSSAPRRVSAPLVDGGTVAYDYAITPDSRGVVYIAAQDVVDRFELYHAPVDPRGRATKLNGPMTAGGDLYVFHIAPDGRRVAYMANQDDEDVMELYLSRLLPGAREAALGQ